MEGDGVANSYAIDGNKPAIITKEQFEEAQKERLRRSNIVVDEYGSSKRKSTHYSMKNHQIHAETKRKATKKYDRRVGKISFCG